MKKIKAAENLSRAPNGIYNEKHKDGITEFAPRVNYPAAEREGETPRERKREARLILRV